MIWRIINVIGNAEMRKITASFIIVLLVICVIGYSQKVFCATYKNQPVPQAPAEEEMEDDDSEDLPPEAEEGAPPGTLFQRISVGMSMQHVVDLIGPPNDTRQYMTGKNFIPFYMGTDTVRMEAIYKGQGRITFTGRPLRVYYITIDPNEPGYNE
jgi:hypothetical protein